MVNSFDSYGENLIRGMPQQVRDGSALLGISSWHMFPDMVLIGDEAAEIVQDDPLFGETSVLTLGIQATGEQSVSWSLPLARLQYYGRPIRATRSAGTDNTRITQEQFAFVIVGSILPGGGTALGGRTSTALLRNASHGCNGSRSSWNQLLKAPKISMYTNTSTCYMDSSMVLCGSNTCALQPKYSKTATN